MSFISATYHAQAATQNSAEIIARSIAIEQTVEVPESLITPTIERDIVGTIISVKPLTKPNDPRQKGFYEIEMQYDSDLACNHLPQLINLVYGNISIKHTVQLARLTLPSDLLSQFRGPNFGVAGLRKLLEVQDRPLLCTALKPRGLSNNALANLAYEFALGGGDIIKDDHNLVSPDFQSFHDRTLLCQQAVQKANEITGLRCLYAPYLSAPVGNLEEYATYLADINVKAMLISPSLLGLDTVRYIADTFGMCMLAHPTFTGTLYHEPGHGIEIGIFMGLLFRLAGIDATVFTNFNGRFPVTKQDCMSIAHHLRAPLGEIKTAWPGPAGGMQFENIHEMIDAYGNDTMIVIGGALLTRRATLSESTRELLDLMMKSQSS